MTPILTSATAIIVVRDDPISIGDILSASETLTQYFNDVEVVLVANGAAGGGGLDFNKVTATVPDVTVVFLNERVHDDVARLVGIDHSISDYVVFCTPLDFEIAAMPAMIAAAAKGADMVVAESEAGLLVDRSTGATILFWLFRKFYATFAGRPYEWRPISVRMLSRTAALFIASRGDGEVLIRAKTLGSGFTAETVEIPGARNVSRRGSDIRLGISKGLRLMMTGSALPLRATSYVGFFGGIVSMFYVVYILFIYFFKTEVAPGWTTLSLQSAGMMFIISTQLLLLSEYVIQILSASPAASRRRFVAREIRGTLARRGRRLNIVDQEGRYQLGAPVDLLVKDDLA